MVKECRQNEQYKLPQGVLTNNLAQALAYRTHWEEGGRHYDGPKLEVLANRISDELLRKLGVGTIRVLDWLLIHRSKVNCELNLSMDEYMRVTNRRDRPASYAHLKDQLTLLCMLRICAKDDTNRKKTMTSDRLQVVDGFAIGKGNINVKLSQVFYDLTKKYPVAAIDSRLFAVDWRNKAHAYLLGRQLFIHQRLRQRQGNMPEIETRLLLKKCGFSVPKGYERKRVDRIQKPFERDMAALAQVVGLNWRYDSDPRSYEEFLQTKIKIQEELQHQVKLVHEARDDCSEVQPHRGLDLEFEGSLLACQFGERNESADVWTKGICGSW